MKELLPGDPERLGPYQIRSRIGSGGMGVVYLGRSPSGRLAAVKLVRPELADDEEFRTRFRREIDAARQVSGAFTAAVLDADPDAPLPWLATTYVEGPSLRQRVVDTGPLSVPEARRLGSGLAEALADLHRVGLVHRDIKPGNVLLAADGPRLIDFGIIRSDALADLTESGFVLGSAGYMAPEQAEGRRTGPAADVFALGAVLTFALTGRGPFGIGAAATLLLRTVNETPDLADVPEELRGAIGRCLAADPADRPSDRDLITMLAPGAEPLPSREDSASAAPAPRPTSALTRTPTPAPPRPRPTPALPDRAPDESIHERVERLNQIEAAKPRPPVPLRQRPLHERVELLNQSDRIERPQWIDDKNPPAIAGPSRRAALGWLGLVAAGGTVVAARSCTAHPTSPQTETAPTHAPFPIAGTDPAVLPTGPARSTTAPVWQVTDVGGTSLSGLQVALGTPAAGADASAAMLYGMTDRGLVGIERNTGQAVFLDGDAPLKPGAGAIVHAPLVEKDTVYLVTGSNLVAVSRADKTVRWQADISTLRQPRLLGHVGSSLVLFQDTADGAWPMRVTALDDTKHTEQWSLAMGQGDGVALTDEGLLVRADPSGAAITAHRLTDGHVVWTAPFPDPPAISASVATAAGRVFVGGTRVLMLDAKTGTDPVTVTTGDYHVFAAKGESVYAFSYGSASSDTGIVALGASGQRLWSSAPSLGLGAYDRTFLLTGGALVVASTTRRQITAMEPGTGTVRWQWSETTGSAIGLPAGFAPGYSLVTDGTELFVGAATGVYCFSLTPS